MPEKVIEREAFPNIALGNFFLTFLRLLRDSRLSQKDFLNKYTNVIKKAFPESLDNNTIPVLICAHNEEKQLPLLLHALSKSSASVKPVVVNNHSTDDTGDIARSLGAEVIEEPIKGLMPALIAGFRYLNKVRVSQFLLTDADTYPTTSWASTMNKLAGSIDPDSGGVIYGQAIYYGEPLRDLARTTSEMLGDLIYLAHHKVVASGPNGFIKFGENGQIATQLTTRLNPNIALSTDKYVRDQVIEAGGQVKKTMTPNTWVFARGDRYPNFFALFNSPPFGHRRHMLYQDWLSGNTQGVVYNSPYELWGK